MLSISSASAIFSQFLILDEDSYKGETAKYRPSLKVNEKNPNFIDVRIPHHDDGQSYWLVVATEALPDEKLEFRGIVWGNALHKEIQSIARLGESVDLWETPPKRRGFIDFTIHKDLLPRCYVYNDYEFDLDDGGFYYTYKLSKHKVEQVGAGQPATRPQSDSEGGDKPQPEAEGCSR